MSSEIDKVKVVRIIARLNIGGPAIQAILLTECLGSEGFTSYLIAGNISKNEGDMMPYAVARNVHPIMVPELGREISGMKDVVAFVKLVKFLRKVRPHVVHTHTAKAGTLGRVAAWVARVPIKVHTFHGHVFSGYFGWGKTKLFILIERVLAFLSDCILVLSDHQRQELVDVFRIAPNHKFQVVPLGFDLEPFLYLPGSTRNFHQRPTGTPSVIIGFIGRLAEIKNPFLAFDAFSVLDSRSRKVPSWELWVAGGGPLEESLKRSAKKTQLTTKIRFLGWQSDMPRLYSSVDVVILTSLNEGTPVALIEAMASGKPFISTNVGGVRDLMVGTGQCVNGNHGGKFTVYDNGILVSSEDVYGLADALEYLVSDHEKMVAMGRVGREFAKTQFTKEQLLKNIQSLYQKLLQKKGIKLNPCSREM